MNINDTFDMYNELVEIRTIMASGVLTDKTKNEFIQKKLDFHLVKLRAELDQFDQWCDEEAERSGTGENI